MRAGAQFLRSQTAWLAGTTGCIAVTLIGLFFWMSLHSRQVAVGNAYVSSSNLALSVEQFTERTIDEVDLALGAAGQAIGVHRTMTPEKIAAALPRSVKQAPEIDNLLVIGADGAVRYSALPLKKPGVNLSRVGYFKMVLNSDQIALAVGQPVAGPSGHRALYISRRFVRPDGSFAGVIAATLNADYVERFFSTLNIGERGVIAISTTAGTMLVERPSKDEDIGKNFSSSPLFREMLPWASSGVFPMEYENDGLRRIVGYQRVGKFPLVVEVALSHDEALANWRRTTIIQAVICAVMLIVLFAMAFVLHRELKARIATVGELERARRAAEASSRVKSQFLANMSHELRTPLNAIIGFSEMIRDAIIGPVAQRYREYASDIHNSGRHLVQLIGDILDLSKIEAGRLELHEETVNLVTVVDDCRRLMTDRVSRSGLGLTTNLPPDLPQVRADELRLKQVLLNLLSNAVKFTPGGGRIDVSASMTMRGGIDIAVSDTGIGMKPEEIPIALAPFRQVEGSVKKRYEGTGLGLPLARTLIELHGGSLRIASTPGRGTTITVTLPAKRVLRQGVPTASADGPKLRRSASGSASLTEKRAT